MRRSTRTHTPPPIITTTTGAAARRAGGGSRDGEAHHLPQRPRAPARAGPHCAEPPRAGRVAWPLGSGPEVGALGVCACVCTEGGKGRSTEGSAQQGNGRECTGKDSVECVCIDETQEATPPTRKRKPRQHLYHAPLPLISFLSICPSLYTRHRYPPTSKRFRSLLLLLLLLLLPLALREPRQVVRGVVPPAVEQQLLARQLHAQVQAARAVCGVCFGLI